MLCPTNKEKTVQGKNVNSVSCQELHLISNFSIAGSLISDILEANHINVTGREDIYYIATTELAVYGTHAGDVYFG